MKHESLSRPPEPVGAAANGPRWTPRKIADFLRALGATHSVKAAAKSVGMSRQSAYRLRARLKGKAFDAAWDEAFHHSYHNLPYAALERAMNGTEVPHYYRGEIVGTSRRYDERLTVALLKMISSAPCLTLGSDFPGAVPRGRRLDTLLAAIEAEGENAANPAPADDFGAGSREVSSLSDAEIMAELRGFEPNGGE